MFTYVAFEESKLLSRGSLETIIVDVKKRFDAYREAQILIFSDSTGKQMDFDLSGTEKEVLERLKVFKVQDSSVTVGAGRPKLGVVSREISLLPTHWEWLENQQGGASATLRRLIDDKVKICTSNQDKVKRAQEVTYTFLNAIAGNLPHFEEAVRFLYRRDKDKFLEYMAGWPEEVVGHALGLAEEVFELSNVVVRLEGFEPPAL